MQLELISPDNGSVVLSHTVSLGLLGSLRAAGVDLSALLPKEAIASTWDTSLVPLLEGYLDHLRANTQGTTTHSHLEHVVIREVDMTPEEKAELRAVAYTSKSVNDATVFEYDRVVVVSDAPVVDPHVEEERASLLDLIAFFRRGESEHDLLHNDLYVVPEALPAQEEETGVHAEVLPLS